MSYEIRTFGKDECTTAAELSMDAFASNPFRAILYPGGTGPSMYDLVYKKLLESVDDPDSHLIQLYDPNTSRMIAYAIWTYTKPVAEEAWDGILANRLDDVKGLNQDAIVPFVTSEIRARRKVIGSGRWWELVSMQVGADYQKKGLGRLLVQWGIDKQEQMQWPSFMIASQAGDGLYRKCGYEVVDKWTIDLGKYGGTGIYQNTILTRVPK